jgi:hypothetical protein
MIMKIHLSVHIDTLRLWEHPAFILKTAFII